MDDDNFIDDTGVDPADGYGIDHVQRSPGDHPEVSGFSHIIMFIGRIQYCYFVI